MNNNPVLHKQLSYAIIGAAMDVHNKLGPGWDEEAYHEALLQALRSKGIMAKSKLRGVLKHRYLVADEFELDILIEDKIILELKHVLSPFAPAHYLQLLNYLKFWNCDLGLLINFGMDRLQHTRIPFTPGSGDITFSGPWEMYRLKHMETATLFESIFKALMDAHGLGYSTGVNKNLFKAECACRQVIIDPPMVELIYDQITLGSKSMDAFCIDSHTLVTFSALDQEASAVDIRRILSYLRQSALSKGVIANFGKHHLNLNLIAIP